MLDVALVLLVSCIVGFIGTVLSIPIAKWIGIVDRPGAIKIHDRDVPRFGGLGVLLGVWLTAAGAAYSRYIPLDRVVVWFVAPMPLVIAGALDDIRGLRPGMKLLGQALSSFGAGAIIVAGSHSGISGVHLVLTAVVSGGFLCYMANSANLLDGMDGLLSGITIIVSTTLAIMALVAQMSELVLFPTLVAGSALGFLFLNLPPARTFMGDMGSNFLGFVLGVAGLQCIAALPLSPSRLIGVGLVFLVPIADTTFAAIRRLLKGDDPFAGDRLHIYDCLHERLGRRPWITLTAMWSITSISCGLGVAAFFLRAGEALLLAICGVVSISWLGHRIGSLGKDWRTTGVPLGR